LTDYFIDMFGPTIGPTIGLVALVALILLGLWVLFLIVRRFRSGLFISGGTKGRLPRLAVTDAVPVDSHRRLILVRRDDVEHLIMIGGPSDIVVESGIGKPQPVAPQPRMPVQTTQPQAAPQPAPQQRPAIQAAREAVADVERGRPVRIPDPQFTERRPEPPVAATPPPVAPPVTQPTPTFVQPPVVASTPPIVQTPPAQPPSTATPAVASRSSPELDLDKLLDELRPNPLQDR
jgi:flagellar protein FliO/FliZ